MDVAATSKLPSPLCLSGNVHENWIKFKEEFDDYLVSIEFDDKSDKVKTAKLRNLIGDEGRHVVEDLNLKKSSDYGDMIAKLDNWAKSHRNLSLLRSQFFDRKQDENESFENFLNDVKTLAKRCNFGDLTEDLLRDKIVTGIFDPQLKQLFNTTCEVPLESAIQLCRVINLSEDHLLKLLTLKRGGKISFKDFVSEGVGKSYTVDKEDEESDDEDIDVTVSTATDTHAPMSVGKKHRPALHIKSSQENAQLRNEDSESPLKTLKRSSDEDSDVDKNIENEEKIEATVSFTVEKISELTAGRILSPPLKFHDNFSWQILVMRRVSKMGTETLGVYVQCNYESESYHTSKISLPKQLEPWSCKAACKLTVLSQRAGTEPLSKKFVHTYTSKEPDWGFSDILSLYDLLNPDKGYILNGSVMFEAKITILETP